jgi:hypothetical protein
MERNGKKLSWRNVLFCFGCLSCYHVRSEPNFGQILRFKINTLQQGAAKGVYQDVTLSQIEFSEKVKPARRVFTVDKARDGHMETALRTKYR